MENIKILNVNILLITEEELLQRLHKGVLITPNLDHLIKLQKDKALYKCYQKADWIICDSKILYLCSKLLKKSLVEPIPGSSFFTHLYEYHRDDENFKIFLLGAMDGIAEKAKDNINRKIGREIIVGAYSPSYGFENKPEENEHICKMIRNSKANAVLVGVGCPKQEKWIFAHKDKIPEVDIWMALGATIDFEAGNIKRAPIIFQKLALEWLYRFIKEPKRLFKRYFVDDMKFFYYFAKQLLGIYKNPFSDK